MKSPFDTSGPSSFSKDPNFNGRYHKLSRKDTLEQAREKGPLHDPKPQNFTAYSRAGSTK